MEIEAGVQLKRSDQKAQLEDTSVAKAELDDTSAMRPVEMWSGRKFGTATEPIHELEGSHAAPLELMAGGAGNRHEADSEGVVSHVSVKT